MEGKEDIMAVARAFMRSRIILTAAELDLFTIIQDSLRAQKRLPKDSVSIGERLKGSWIASLPLDCSVKTKELIH